MGCLYKRKQRLASGEYRELPTWWIKYYQGGRAVRASTGTTKETVARRILRTREGDVEKGIPIVPQMGKITFDEAVDDLLNDYTNNGKRTHEDAKRRIDLHLKPVFKGRRLISITTADVRAYIASRLPIEQPAGSYRSCSIGTANVSAIFAKLGIPRVRRRGARAGFLTTSDGQQCGIWNAPVCHGWQWSDTRPRQSTDGTPLWMPLFSARPQQKSMARIR